MQEHVFVCYAREDQDFALDLARKLKSLGVKVWVDQWDIPPTADWDQAVDEALYSCAYLLIVLSPTAVERREVRAELRAALDENKPIVPVLYQRCRVPRQLRVLQLIDFADRDPDDESALGQILKAVGVSPAQPAPLEPRSPTAEPRPSGRDATDEGTGASVAAPDMEVEPPPVERTERETTSRTPPSVDRTERETTSRTTTPPEPPPRSGSETRSHRRITSRARLLLVGAVAIGLAVLIWLVWPSPGGLELTALGVGSSHSCGLDSAGAAFCWGSNEKGQLGDGSSSDRARPVLVSGGIRFHSVGVGERHTCGVGSAGDIYCWGLNEDGQLGDSSEVDRSAPVRVRGELVFESVALGDRHTCGLSAQGDAYCWGRNNSGQLGDGTTTNRVVPVPVSGELSFASLSLGTNYTCGLSSDGTAYCWGYRGHGRLGDGAEMGSNPNVPSGARARVTPTPVLGGLRFLSLSAGGTHACGIATDSLAYCWGQNYGQLGDGSKEDRSEPVVVSGGIRFARLSAGLAHTCGVTREGHAYCWGSNQSAQLGQGEPVVWERTTPAAVVGDLDFASVAAGRYHTCGITTGGLAYCWGRDDSGWLGIGSKVNTCELSSGLRFPCASRPARVSGPAG